MPETVHEDQIYIFIINHTMLDMVERSTVTRTFINVYIVNINIFSPAFFPSQLGKCAYMKLIVVSQSNLSLITMSQHSMVRPHYLNLIFNLTFL